MVDQPIRTVSQSSHTTKHMVPSEHAQRRSDRHYSRSPESELELEINTMECQLENSCHSSCDTPNRRKMSMRSTSNKVPEFELVENSWSSAEHQMNDRDLLAMFDSPKRHTLTIRPKTRRSQRLEETTTDIIIGAEIDRLLESEPEFDDTCAPSTESISDRELLAMFECPRKPLTNRKQRKEEASQRRSLDTAAEVEDLLEGALDFEESRTSSTSHYVPRESPRQQRRLQIAGTSSPDIATEIDELLKDEPQWKESRVAGTSHQMPKNKAKCESPIARISVSIGQRGYLESDGKSQESHQYYRSQQKENPINPLISKAEESTQRCSLDIEAEIDRLLDGEIEWEEFCAPRPVEGELLAKFESPRKSIKMSMGQRRREEAVKRYKNTHQSTLHGFSSSTPQERCRNPVTRHVAAGPSAC